MNVSFESIENTLKKNIADVYQLAHFDRIVLDFAINQLEGLEKKLNKDHFIDNPQLTAATTRKSLENIRTNESLKSRFEIINNQCVVLLVSLFASAIADLYRDAITNLALSGTSPKLNDEELKFTVSEIVRDDTVLAKRIGRLMEEKRDVSFQDMKSIGRAFKEYFDVKIDRGNTVNNIIMAQAGRHVIVHDGAMINDRLRKQVGNAVPRELMPAIPNKGRLLFQPKELKIAGSSMLEYFSELRLRMERRFDDQG